MIRDHLGVGYSKKKGQPNTADPFRFLLEAASGFEPLNNGFADHCLTTWLRRLFGGGNLKRSLFVRQGKMCRLRPSAAGKEKGGGSPRRAG